MVVLVAGALQGGEVLLMEASELVKRRLNGKHHPEHPHVVVPLMGRFKNESKMKQENGTCFWPWLR